MRAFSILTIAALTASGNAFAQNFATADQPQGVTTAIGSSERVTRVFTSVPQPASAAEIEQVTSVPVYETYQPSGFDAQAYDAARQGLVPGLVPQPPAFTVPVDVTPQGSGFVVEDFSQPLGAPQTFAPADRQATPGEIGFSQETETSRLLLALEETFARRTADLKAKNLAQRRAMLDQFQAEAADPKKVIGLADRMRSALAEFDAAHAAMLAVEEQQFNAATLSVLDRAPSRVQ